MRLDHRFLPLRGKNLSLYLLIGAIACAAIQVLLGGSPIVVVLCLAAVAPGLLALAGVGVYNVGSWVCFAYVLGNALVALYSKTLLGQGLDSYLEAPIESYLAVCIGSWAIFGALLAVRSLPVGAPVLKRLEPRRMNIVAWGCFLLGAAASIVNRLLTNVDDLESSFGGTAIFRELLFAAVILRTAMLLELSSNRRSMDIVGIVFLAAAVAGGLVDNQKTAAALPVVAYLATVVFYRGGLSARLIGLVLAGALVFSAVVSPVVHALRFFGQQSLTLEQRVDFISDVVESLIQHPEQLEAMKDIAAQQFEGGYYNYFGPNGSGQMLLGRYASVQQIDPVIARADRVGLQGGDALWPALPRLLPRFLNDDKKPYVEEYYTLVYLGLYDPEGGKYPTLPLVGQSYAAYGFLGVLIVPFATFVLFFLSLKKLGWRIARNPFAIFLLVQFAIAYAAQGSFAQYAGAALRYWPTLALVLIVLTYISRVRIGPRAEPRWEKTPTVSLR